jgi:hypothetical protein
MDDIMIVKPTPPKTPELDKRHKIIGEAHFLGEFLDWLNEDGYRLAKYDEDDELHPTFESPERLLARFFKIDLDKVEAEKLALLEYQRKLNDYHDQHAQAAADHVVDH